MNDKEKKPPPKGKVPKGKVQVHLPANLEPAYANFALVTNSASEVVIDFAQVMPRTPAARIKSRVVMTALNAKLLMRAMTEHIARFEKQYGEIDLPEGVTLADQLFRFPSGDPPEEE